MVIKNTEFEKVTVPISQNETEERIKVTETIEDTKSQIYSKENLEKSKANYLDRIAKIDIILAKFEE